MVFVENLKFWNISLLGKEVRETVFLYSIWWKIAILDDKNVDLLMMKKSKFSKGDIAHGFCQKLKSLILFLFELFRCCKSVVLNDVLNSKQTILDEKNVHL